MNVYISQLIDDKKLYDICLENDFGIETIDFSIASNLDNPSRYIEKYNDSKYSSINIGIHGPFFDLMPATFDNLIKEVTLKRFNDAYAIAKEINAKHIIFHTGFLKNIYFYEAWLDNSVEFWKEFLKDKDDSIPVYIENVFEEEYSYILELVKEVNCSFFNICLDIGHANIRSKHPIKDWVLKLAPYIKHVHLHNNNSENDSHSGLDIGTVDYESIFKLIKELDINCNFTLEINDESELLNSINILKKIAI